MQLSLLCFSRQSIINELNSLNVIRINIYLKTNRLTMAAIIGFLVGSVVTMICVVSTRFQEDNN